MYIAPRGHGLVDLLQEFQELFRTMALPAIVDYWARFYIQRCEERGLAVAFVIMGDRSRAALLLWKPRLGTIQRLYLGFFVDAECLGK